LEDVALLARLWNVLFGAESGSYERSSQRWKVHKFLLSCYKAHMIHETCLVRNCCAFVQAAGFMKPDPVLDLKRAGMLALKYVVRHEERQRFTKFCKCRKSTARTVLSIFCVAVVWCTLEWNMQSVYKHSSGAKVLE
jgi:hypothetical protein